MRYIRTENGEIYDISDGNFGCDDDDNWFIRLNKEKMFICLKEDEKRYIGKITANKDTVDELCDFIGFGTPTYEQAKPFLEMFGKPYPKETYREDCKKLGYALAKAPQPWRYVEEI